MDVQKLAVAVFRDFEKLYRLSGIYQGNAGQLEKQLAYIDNNIESFFRGPLGRSGSLRFDLLMATVLHQGEEVFRSKTPEMTLSYALFYEGIKSITIRGGITAGEMLDWINTVKEVLFSSGDEGEEDLASVLWKKSSQNIKVSLYSLFSEFDEEATGSVLGSLDAESDEDFDEALRKEVIASEFEEASEGGLDKSWEQSEHDWNLPSGDLIVQKLGSLGIFDSEAAKKLKHELSDSVVSDRAKKILRFSAEEIEVLRKEMESYDENQVEFNLMVHYFGILEDSKSQGRGFAALVRSSVKTIIQAVVSRFHAGLILFSLRRLKQWRESEQAKEYEEFQSELKASITNGANLQVLGEAFGVSSRLKVARELLDYIDLPHYRLMLNSLGVKGRAKAKENLLKVMLERKIALEEMLPGWSPEELKGVLPQIIRLDWEQKNVFLLRCLRSKNQQVLEEIISIIHQVQLSSQEARVLFERQSDSLKRKWLEALLKGGAENWADFIRRGLQNQDWLNYSEEIQGLWISLSFKLLGPQAFSQLEPIVKSRRLILFPKFSKERELVLSILLNQKDHKLMSLKRTWIEEERNLLFQNAELKQRLREAIS